MRELGITRDDLAERCGFAPTTLKRFFRLGTCRIFTLKIICEVLGIDLASLDLRSNPGLRWTAITEEGQAVQLEARKRGMGDYELAQAVGINRSTLRDWMHGLFKSERTERAIKEYFDDRYHRSSMPGARMVTCQAGE